MKIEKEIRYNIVIPNLIANRLKTKKGKFNYKCICDWSKNDKYGFIPNTECPVHGKATKKMLKKTVPYKEKK